MIIYRLMSFVFLLSAGIVQASQCFVEIEDDDRKIFAYETIDASVSTFRVGEKNIWIYPSANASGGELQVSHKVTVGSIESPAETDIIGTFTEQVFFGADPSESGYKWLTNILQLPDGILGLVHAEYTGPNDYWGMPCDPWDARPACGPGESKIGLAWMPTGPGFYLQPQFQYLGHIIGATSARMHHNIFGAPFYITNESGVSYLNVLYHDTNANNRNAWGHIARARAPLSDIVSAAIEGRVSPWEKWHSNGWQDALTGDSRPVLPQLATGDSHIDRGRILLHSDAVNIDGRYVLVGYTYQHDGEPSRLVFYDSCDGQNWRFNRTARPLRENYTYLSIVNSDGRDNGNARGDFKILAGRSFETIERITARLLGDCTCQ